MGNKRGCQRKFDWAQDDAVYNEKHKIYMQKWKHSNNEDTNDDNVNRDLLINDDNVNRDLLINDDNVNMDLYINVDEDHVENQIEQHEIEIGMYML